MYTVPKDQRGEPGREIPPSPKKKKKVSSSFSKPWEHASLITAGLVSITCDAQIFRHSWCCKARRKGGVIPTQRQQNIHFLKVAERKRAYARWSIFIRSPRPPANVILPDLFTQSHCYNALWSLQLFQHLYPSMPFYIIHKVHSQISRGPWSPYGIKDGIVIEWHSMGGLHFSTVVIKTRKAGAPEHSWTSSSSVFINEFQQKAFIDPQI